MNLQELEKWFMSLVADKPASDYKNVLKNLTPVLNQYGIGQQHDSGGEPRGRLFLPTSKCLNTAPKTPDDIFLGVNQNPACWERVIDVVNNGKWDWIDHGGPEYVPFLDSNPVPQPVPTFPSYESLGGDAVARDLLGKLLQLDYSTANQPMNDGTVVWTFRTLYDAFQDIIVNKAEANKAITKSVDKHRPEWRKELGLDRG